MSSNPTINIFTKPDCNFCTRAKSVLQQEGLDYIEHDVEQSGAMAAASQYFSGTANLPQIFVGSQHINGAEDLEALRAAGLLGRLVSDNVGELSLDSSHEDHWIAGAEDFTLAGVLDKVDIAQTIEGDEENLLIAHFYKGMFGYTPISYLYLGIWPEAYKACALSNVIVILPVLMMGVGEHTTFSLTYGASSSQGCNYCTMHAAAVTGKENTDIINALRAARDGTAGPDNPFSELDLAMVELAEQATLNKVTADQIDNITALANAESRDPQQVIEGAGLGAQLMGLLNIFNDLLNVEIEGGLARLANAELGLEGGRHVTTDSDPNDLDFELPESTLTVETALAARREQVSDWQGLARQKLGYVPGWLSSWPELLRPVFTGAYTELMGDTEVSAELKQLMARTSAIAKGHEALAASAAISAYHSAQDKDRAVERIRHCFAAATDQTDTDLFTPAERVALRLAWISAQTPIMTQAQFVKPLTEHFSQREIVELCVTCGMACAAQRMCAALQVPPSEDETAFCREHGIETDGLLLKYPRLIA